MKKSQNYQFFRRWLGNGLLISDGRFWISGTKETIWRILGDYWRRHRKILTLAFHTEILKDFVGVFESVGDVLIEKLGKYDGKSSVDVHRLVTLCTLDTICGKYSLINISLFENSDPETAMGTKMNVQSGENSQYVQSVQQMGRIVIERTLSLIKVSKYTFWLTRDYYIQKNALKILHGFTLSVIDSKRNKPVEKTTKRMAFLDLLLKVSHDENILTIGELQEEVDTFMFEVHECGFSTFSILWFLRDTIQQLLVFLSFCIVWPTILKNRLSKIACFAVLPIQLFLFLGKSSARAKTTVRRWQKSPSNLFRFTRHEIFRMRY